jgi:hypothetical protein
LKESEVNIYQFLKRDHARQRALANAILEVSASSARRYRLFVKFKQAVRQHARH